MRMSSLMAVEDCSSVGCSLQWQQLPLLPGGNPVLPAPPSLEWPTPLPGIRGPADQSHQKNIYVEHGRVCQIRKSCQSKGFLSMPSFAVASIGGSGSGPGVQNNYLAAHQPPIIQLLCHLHEGCDGQRKERLPGY